MESFLALLKIKNVSKTIGKVRLLEDINVSFLPGKINGLIGPNGAGKTTLFHIISGELRPDGGRILYGGTEITGLPPYKIARMGIGRLFQDVRVFEGLTALENVTAACYGPDNETPWYPFIKKNALNKLQKEIAGKGRYWLEFVGLLDQKNVQAASLSFGQQKLLAIARLLAAGFSVLLLDEPTAGLSPTVMNRILALLKKIVDEDESKTIVLVEHNMSVVMQVADWVYFMHDGRISFFGMTDHVLGHQEVREAYLGF